MKNTVLICFLLLSVNKIFAQEMKSISFILVINDKIIDKKTKLNFISISESGSEVLTALYYPGSLILNNFDYEKLMSAATKTIYLKYNDAFYINGKGDYYDYEIEYKKEWLKDLYNILRIYDLNIKKYKREFDPLSQTKNYTFEIVSPNTTFIRIRKK